MSPHPISFRPEKPEDGPAIDRLAAAAFGPGRFSCAAYRLRHGVPHDAALSFVGEAGDRLIGSVRMTPILIGSRQALLLGPLVVNPDWKDKGCGHGLIRLAVDAARANGYALIILVGDLAYYQPFGFRRTEPLGAVVLPAPVDPARLLVAELVEGAAAGLSGDAKAILTSDR